MRIKAMIVLTLGLIAGACSSSRGGDGQPRADRNIITRAQMDSVTLNTAYEVVQRFRPDMIYGRGRTTGSDASSQMAVVYVDGTGVGTSMYCEPFRPATSNRFVFWGPATP